jgi:5,10-methylene-tetrahydrofolate dehydrogenase/methenyl tetrahydrofolate cyclohydrolase
MSAVAKITADAVPAAAPAATGGGGGGKIDGKAMAGEVQAEVKAWGEELRVSHSVTPGLGVVLVGDRSDSNMYVRLKQRAATRCGLHSTLVKLAADVTQEQLEHEVDTLMADADVHGVLVQLPLPEHIDEHAVLKRIGAHKDVDGLGAENVGNLYLRGGEPPAAVACTPAAVVEMLQRTGVKIAGKSAVVLGRSNLVGMPLAALLQSMNATVTVCHSATPER